MTLKDVKGLTGVTCILGSTLIWVDPYGFLQELGLHATRWVFILILAGCGIKLLIEGKNDG